MTLLQKSAYLCSANYAPWKTAMQYKIVHCSAKCSANCVLDYFTSAVQNAELCMSMLCAAPVQIVHLDGGGCAPKGEYQTMQLSADRSFGGPTVQTQNTPV